jgi:hypothetical protein
MVREDLSRRSMVDEPGTALLEGLQGQREAGGETG